MKPYRYALIYRMLDRKGLVTEYFYHEEEARSALGNVEYVDTRDVIQILDVVEGKYI